MRSPWHRHKTNRIPLPDLIISAFLLICCLCGTKQSCLTVKWLDIAHCLCCHRWENGKSQWPAINISVSAVFVFTSLLLWDSHLSYLASLLRFEFFLCVIVPSQFLYYPTLRYHDKNRLLLRGRLRLFAIVIVFDWKSKITLTRQRQKLKIWRENILSLRHYQQGSLVYFPPSPDCFDWP